MYVGIRSPPLEFNFCHQSVALTKWLMLTGMYSYYERIFQSPFHTSRIH
jgi:hypothetical protein